MTFLALTGRVKADEWLTELLSGQAELKKLSSQALAWSWLQKCLHCHWGRLQSWSLSPWSSCRPLSSRAARPVARMFGGCSHRCSRSVSVLADALLVSFEDTAHVLEGSLLGLNNLHKQQSGESGSTSCLAFGGNPENLSALLVSQSGPVSPQGRKKSAGGGIVWSLCPWLG